MRRLGPIRPPPNRKRSRKHNYIIYPCGKRRALTARACHNAVFSKPGWRCKAPRSLLGAPFPPWGELSREARLRGVPGRVTFAIATCQGDPPLRRCPLGNATSPLTARRLAVGGRRVRVGDLQNRLASRRFAPPLWGRQERTIVSRFPLGSPCGGAGERSETERGSWRVTFQRTAHLRHRPPGGATSPLTARRLAVWRPPGTRRRFTKSPR